MTVLPPVGIALRYGGAGVSGGVPVGVVGVEPFDRAHAAGDESC